MCTTYTIPLERDWFKFFGGSIQKLYKSPCHLSNEIIHLDGGIKLKASIVKNYQKTLSNLSRIKFLLIILLFFINLSHTNVFFIKNTRAINSSSDDLIIIPLNIEAWNFSVAGAIQSSPAIVDVNDDGVADVLFGARDEYFYALDGADGSQIWNYTNGEEIYSSPCLGDIDNDTRLEVIFGTYEPSTQERNVVAINIEDNTHPLWIRKKWNRTLDSPNPVTAAPVVADVDNDRKLEVIVASSDYPFSSASANSVYALNGEDGSILWDYPLGDSRLSYDFAPAVGDLDNDGNLEVVMPTGTDDNRTYVINGEDGTLDWYFEAEGAVTAAPILCNIDEDDALEVIIGSYYRKWFLYVLDGKRGKLQYKIGTPPILSAPAVGDLNGDARLEIVATTYHGVTYCFDSRDGTILWSSWSGYTSGGFSSPAIADANSDGTLDVILGSSEGYLYFLSGKDGSVLYSIDTGGEIEESPALYDLNNDGSFEIIISRKKVLEPTLLRVYHMLWIPGNRIYWQGEGGTNSFTRTKCILDVDNDLDYLSDHSEALFGTNSSEQDTDKDMLQDGEEAHLGLSPITMDSDQDGLQDGQEALVLHTNPTSNDTDLDTMLDGWENDYNLDPLVNDANEDLDRDGLTNVEEYGLGTLPNVPDTDGDRLTDHQEVEIYFTDPLKWDSDGDGMSDGFEVNSGKDPNVSSPLSSQIETQPESTTTSESSTEKETTPTEEATSLPGYTLFLLTLIFFALFVTKRKPK